MEFVCSGGCNEFLGGGNTIGQFQGRFDEYARALRNHVLEGGGHALVLAPIRYVRGIVVSLSSSCSCIHQGRVVCVCLAAEPGPSSASCQGPHIMVGSPNCVYVVASPPEASKLRIRTLVVYDVDELLFYYHERGYLDRVFSLIEPGYHVCVLYRTLTLEVSNLIDRLSALELCPLKTLQPEGEVPKSLANTAHYVIRLKDEDEKMHRIGDLLFHWNSKYPAVVYCRNGHSVQKVVRRLRGHDWRRAACFSHKHMKPEDRKHFRGRTGWALEYQCIVADDVQPEWPANELVAIIFDVPRTAARYKRLVSGTDGRWIMALNLLTEQELPAFQEIQTELGFGVVEDVERFGHPRVWPRARKNYAAIVTELAPPLETELA